MNTPPVVIDNGTGYTKMGAPAPHRPMQLPRLDAVAADLDPPPPTVSPLEPAPSHPHRAVCPGYAGNCEPSFIIPSLIGTKEPSKVGAPSPSSPEAACARAPGPAPAGPHV